MREYTDAHLWKEYEQAADDAARRKVASKLVEFHMGFIVKYANDTAFPYWPKHVIDEYIQELVIAVMEKIPSYDRCRVTDEGHNTSFIGYVKPSLKPVRWRVAADQDLIRHGVETRRMKADLERWLEQEHATTGQTPSHEEMAEYLTRLHGKSAKPVREGQVRRLLDQPQFVWADGGADNDETVASSWDTLTAKDAQSIEDAYLDADEERLRAQAVTDALAAAGLSSLEKAIVAERLMMAPRRIVDGDEVSPGPTTYTNLAKRFKVRPEDVRQTEQDLLERLRGLIDL